MLRFVAAILLFTAYAWCSPTGAPDAACGNMNTQHNGTAQTGEAPYIIDVVSADCPSGATGCYEGLPFISFIFFSFFFLSWVDWFTLIGFFSSFFKVFSRSLLAHSMLLLHRCLAYISQIHSLYFAWIRTKTCPNPKLGLQNMLG